MDDASYEIRLSGDCSWTQALADLMGAAAAKAVQVSLPQLLEVAYGGRFSQAQAGDLRLLKREGIS